MKNFNFSQNTGNQLQSSFTVAEIRINKDLLEMKQYRITTKLFEVKFSNVYRDYLDNKLTMIVSMESVESRKIFEFFIYFYPDYPFSPPEINSINRNFPVTLNIILKPNWSPVLSINSVLFALELMLLDPDSESKMNFRDFYETQESNRQENFESSKLKENFLFTNSPKIINHKHNFLNGNSDDINPYYVRKKRLLSELENINDDIFLENNVVKKFKYSKDSLGS